MTHSEPPASTSTAGLITQLSEQTTRLVRDELKLARAELMATAKQGGIGAGLFGASGLLALFGFAALIATAIIALSLVLPAWLAALIVTVLLFIAAGIAALVGKKKVEDLSPVPERTVESVKRDIHEVKEHTHRDHV